MHKLTLALAACLAAMIALPAGAAEVIKLVEHPVNETTVDIGAKGDSVGDLLTFANPIFDAANKLEHRFFRRLR